MVQARLKTLIVTVAGTQDASSRRAAVLEVNPEFCPDVFKYTIEVPHTVEAVEISAAAGQTEDEDGLSVKLVVSSGNGVVALQRGKTTRVAIKVDAEVPDRDAHATYMLAIRRAQDPEVVAKKRLLGIGAASAALAVVLGVAVARK